MRRTDTMRRKDDAEEGSWRAPFRFFACIGTMNRGGRCVGRDSVLDCGSPLPLLRPQTRSKSARGLAQSKTWRPFGRLMESPLSFFKSMHWDHEPVENPLTRPSAFAKATADRSDTLSPSGGEGWGEGVRWFMESCKPIAEKHRTSNVEHRTSYGAAIDVQYWVFAPQLNRCGPPIPCSKYAGL